MRNSEVKNVVPAPFGQKINISFKQFIAHALMSLEMQRNFESDVFKFYTNSINRLTKLVPHFQGQQRIQWQKSRNVETVIILVEMVGKRAGVSQFRLIADELEGRNTLG